MTSAVYLEHYLDSLEQLPVELQRNFTLMRELDTRSQELLRAIDKAADDILCHYDNNSVDKAPVKVTGDRRKEAVASIQAQYIKVKEYADDKVQLAIQTYELVDKHIRRLDCDLARFETEIQEKAEKAAAQQSTKKRKQIGIGAAGRKKIRDKELKRKKKKRLISSSHDEESSHTPNPVNNKKKRSLGGGGGNGTGGDSSSAGGGGSQGGGDVKKEQVKEEVDEEDDEDEEIMDMPVDPNEPTYCLCHQVSYGEMIGCDYPDCPIEWFHFACVGLTTKPKGKWFCPKCTTDKKKK